MSKAESAAAAPVDVMVIVSPAELIAVRWKTAVCNSGEACWCRCVVPEHDVVYDNGMEAFIAGDGELGREIAEHVVALHNTWLESR